MLWKQVMQPGSLSPVAFKEQKTQQPAMAEKLQGSWCSKEENNQGQILHCKL